MATPSNDTSIFSSNENKLIVLDDSHAFSVTKPSLSALNNSVTFFLFIHFASQSLNKISVMIF